MGEKTKEKKEVSERDETGGILGDYTGVLDKKLRKYGFIECEELDSEGRGRVFVLGSELKGVKEGEKVRFTAYLDSNDRCQGKDVVGLGEDGATKGKSNKEKTKEKKEVSERD